MLTHSQGLALNTILTLTTRIVQKWKMLILLQVMTTVLFSVANILRTTTQHALDFIQLWNYFS
jgi:hypothetical protein